MKLHSLAVVLSTTFSISAQQFMPWEHLASKTPYGQPKDTSDSPVPETCDEVPVALHLVARHGSRKPSDGSVEDGQLLVQWLSEPGRRDNIPEDSPHAFLRTWDIDDEYVVEEDSELNFVGMQEHFGIATRLRARFDGPWRTPLNCEFTSTEQRRSSQSGASFWMALFAGEGPLFGDTRVFPPAITSESNDNDKLLYYYESCEALLFSEENEEGLRDFEADTYAAENFPAIAERLSNTLQFNETIPYEFLVEMYDMCGFDIVEQNNLTDRFCPLFTEEEYLIIENMEDIANYWDESVGIAINVEQAADLVQALFDRVNDLDAKSTFGFAHSNTIISTYGLLGLFLDDEPLLANSSDEFLESRLFRSSDFARLASNFAFIVYNCTDETRVKLITNEAETMIPGCSELFCTVSDLAAAWESQLALSFDDVCPLPTAAPAPTECEPCDTKTRSLHSHSHSSSNSTTETTDSDTPSDDDDDDGDESDDQQQSNDSSSDSSSATLLHGYAGNGLAAVLTCTFVASTLFA